MLAAPLGENAFLVALERFLLTSRRRPAMSVASGRSILPPKQQEMLRRAIRLEWITMAFLAGAITLVGLVLGNSQAMKAAWIEDLLSLAPPIAFLVAVRIVRRAPRPLWPYGYHRSIGVGHLVAAVALLTMGTFLIIDSALGVDSPPSTPRSAPSNCSDRCSGSAG